MTNYPAGAANYSRAPFNEKDFNYRLCFNCNRKIMKYSPTIVDNELLYYEIRNDEGMYIGSAIQNQAPFDGCDPVTLKDAEKNARLWAAAPDLLNALEEALPGIEELNGEFQEGWDSTIKKIEAAISKAKGL